MIKRLQVRLPAIPLSCNNPGQVVYTHVPLRYQAVLFAAGQREFMLCGWEGNRRSGIASQLQWYTIYGINGLRQGDGMVHPTTQQEGHLL